MQGIFIKKCSSRTQTTRAICSCGCHYEQWESTLFFRFLCCIYFDLSTAITLLSTLLSTYSTLPKAGTYSFSPMGHYIIRHTHRKQKKVPFGRTFNFIFYSPFDVTTIGGEAALYLSHFPLLSAQNVSVSQSTLLIPPMCTVKV